MSQEVDDEKSIEIKSEEITLVELSKLVPYEKNMHIHTPEQIDRLCDLIRYQGFRDPLIVQRGTNRVAAGHGRMEAAKKLGLKQVPVVYQEFESEEQFYAFVVSHNAIGKDEWAKLDLVKINVDFLDLGPDLDIDMLGLKDFVIEPLDKLDPQCDEDEVPEVKHDSVTKRGDVWLLGEHRVMCGDSTMIDDVEKLMDGQKADLWIADPPFGVSYMEKNLAVNNQVVKNQEGKEIKSDTKSVDELCPFWKDVALNAYSVTTNEASSYWCACQGSDKMMMMMMMLDEAGWNIRHELIWAKDSFVFGRSDYHYQHEPIIYGWKKKGKHNWYSDRKQSSLFSIDRPKKSDLHPTTKPVELFQEFFKNSCPRKGLIYESFAGSGTSVIAAENRDQKCYGMELDEYYCDIIVERWQKYTGKEAVLESTGKTFNSYVKS